MNDRTSAILNRHYFALLALITPLMLTLTFSASTLAKDVVKPVAPVTRAAPERVTSVEGITEYKLANGLRILLFPDQTKPTLTINVTYLVGSRHENYGETGMAHLLEHLMFKGTPTNPDIDKQFNKRGARSNGTTNFDRTNYFELVQASDDNLKWAIDMEADRMVNSNIAKIDLDSEMTVVRNEYERGENSPGGVLYKRMQSVAFDWHNYQNSPIGNRSDIENVKIENLQAFYRLHYQPDNAVLLIAGKFDESTALKLINDAFGKIPKPTRVLPKLWTVEPTQDGERSFTVRRAGNIQYVMLGYKVPSMLHPDSVALTYLMAVLGNSPNGRLHKLLVESGKATGVGAGGGTTVDPGLETVIAVVKEGDAIDEVQKILIDAVENFISTPPTKEEMDRVRTQLVNGFEQTLSSPEALGVGMSEVIAAGDWRLFFYFRDRLAKVTTDDVMRVAKAYFKRDNRTVGLFQPTKQPLRAEIPVAPTAAMLLKDFTAIQTMTAGETFDPDPANIDARTRRYALANGTKIALLTKKTRGEYVNVSMVTHNGDLQSRFGRSTATQIASAMMNRGTTRFTRAQLADEYGKLGIQGGAGLAGAGLRVKRENLTKALELIAHVMKEPTFPESEFEQLRKQALTGLEASKGEPGALAGEAMGLHFNGYPKGDPRHFASRAEGIEEINAVTLPQLRDAHRDFSGFTVAEIAVVGDFDEATVKPVIEKLFGDWKSPLPYKRIEQPYREVAAINKLIETPDKENAVFNAQMLIEMQEDDPQFPALSLANYMFGGGAGLNARLARRIRGKEGLSYGVGTSLSVSDQDRRGVFSASATAAPANIAKLESIFMEELQLARKDGFTAEELANAKSGLLTSRQQSRAQDGNLASSWVDRMHRGRTFAEAAEFDAKYRAATLAEVNAAFAKFIDPAKITIIKAGDFAKVAKAPAK